MEDNLIKLYNQNQQKINIYFSLDLNRMCFVVRE